MKTTTLTFRVWIGILAALSILFGFAGQAYSETAVHVAGIDASMIAGTREKAAQVVVTVVDENNAPVANLSVSGAWSMLLKGKASGITGADGKVTFVSGETKKSGIIRFTVTDVSGDGYVYVPGISYILISSDDPVNLKPIAEASSSLTSGEAPLTIDFDAYGSYDPDGVVESYAWSFCDGSTACEPEVTKCFEIAGTYRVELTVRDDQGAIDLDTVEITVTSGGTDPDQVMFVSDIAMAPVAAKSGITAVAIVFIEADDASPVANATVAGEWSGLNSGIASGVTGADGTVTFTSKRSKKSGDFIFTVTDVTADGFDYSADQNIETSNSITNP